MKLGPGNVLLSVCIIYKTDYDIAYCVFLDNVCVN